MNKLIIKLNMDIGLQIKQVKSVFIIPQVIYPQTNGGKKIILGRILNLLDKHNSVKIICFNSNNEDTHEFNLFCEKHNIKLIIHTPLYAKNKNNKNKYLSYFYSIFSYYPKQAANTNNSSFIKLVNNEIIDYNNIYFESIYFYPVFENISKKKFNVFFLFHNIESLFLIELSKLNSSFLMKLAFLIESVKTRFLERLICKNKSLNFIFLTKIDKEHYLNIYKSNKLNNKTIINQNYIYIENTILRNPDLEKPFILFPGSIEFEPNFEAVKWFLENIFTKDIQKKINLKLIITGGYGNKNKLFDNYTNVIYTGAISIKKLDLLYSKCLYVISPILSGSGVKVKNIESIMKGVPIIMTKFSSIGIELSNNNIFISKNNSIEEFKNVFFGAISRYDKI